ALPICARRAHELLEVLDPRLALLALLLAERLHEAARVDHVVHLLRERQVRDVGRYALDEVEEPDHRRARAPAGVLVARHRAGGAPQRAALPARVSPNRLHGARADAARRAVHDALERGIVVAAGDQPEVGERILDLRPLEEPQAAVDAVREAGGEQVLLEHPGLRVGAVQHGRIGPGIALLHPGLDARDLELHLVSLVSRAGHAPLGPYP